MSPDWTPEGHDSGEGPATPGSRAAAILNASVPLFRVAGVRVKLHWSFFLAALVLAGWTAKAGETTWSTGLLLWGFIQAGILYSLVLLHEFSHAWMAAMRGRPAREIVLTPLGGTAVMDRAMANPGMEAEVAIAGPGLNLLLLAASMVVVAGYGAPPPWSRPLTLTGALRFAFWANVALALFNLVPAYPLDGGRILRAFLAWRKGERRGTRIACRTGQLAGAAFIGLGLWRRGPTGWILAGIGVMNILACQTTIRMLGLGLGIYEDALPEEGVAPERPRETPEERRGREREELDRRLDELLDKVSREGMESLTSSERRFLRRASRHYRERPKP